MRRLRITPLNIGCALLLAWIFLEAFITTPLSWKAWSLKIVLLLVLVISDQFFRFFFRSMKRIWLTEIGFILFTLLIIWLLVKG